MANTTSKYISLAELGLQVPGRVVGFTDGDESLSRLLSMGVVPGALALVLRRAPLGDPLQVRVEGTLLSIRKQDAHQIQVEPV
ncbi:Fe(2+) transport protein A [Thalassocella blandensis]|nr:Fe(2+) transport protein A [Thalassocella blandensis]